jgi:hypothetical protein
VRRELGRWASYDERTLHYNTLLHRLPHFH